MTLPPYEQIHPGDRVMYVPKSGANKNIPQWGVVFDNSTRKVSKVRGQDLPVYADWGDGPSWMPYNGLRGWEPGPDNNTVVGTIFDATELTYRLCGTSVALIFREGSTVTIEFNNGDKLTCESVKYEPGA